MAVQTTNGTAQALAITITGTNDVPTVTGAITGSADDAAAVFTIDLLSGAADVDTSDTLSVIGLTLSGGNASGITVNADSTLSVDPSAYGLNDTQTLDITYTYDVTDSSGGSVAHRRQSRLRARMILLLRERWWALRMIRMGSHG